MFKVCAINDHRYVPFVVCIIRLFPRVWLITVFVTRVTIRVPRAEHKFLSLPEHLRSPLVFNWFVMLDLMFSVSCLVFLSFCPFCFVISLILFTTSFWLHFWYLQTFINSFIFIIFKIFFENMYVHKEIKKYFDDLATLGSSI